MKHRILSYPIFLTCLPLITDKLWKNIFEDLAYGICPSGVYIVNNTLVSKSKTFSYTIHPDLGCEELYHDIVSLFSDKILVSQKKQHHSLFYKEMELITQNRPVIDTWRKIKKKSVKDMIVQNYLIYISKKYNLTDLQAKKIYNFLNIAFMLKLIENDDIVCQNGMIVQIKNIQFKERKILLNLDIFQTE